MCCAEAPAAPPPPAYDSEEYKEELHTRIAQLMGITLNTAEEELESELTHIGSVLDARLDAAQAQLQAALESGDKGAEEQAAWDSFAVLRKREAHVVPTAPPALRVHAKPLRAVL